MLDVQLSGLQGASIQRVYVKLLLRELTRWLAGTLTRGDLVAYAHHVDSQDGHAHSSSRSMTDKAAAAMLRALARSIDEDPRPIWHPQGELSGRVRTRSPARPKYTSDDNPEDPGTLV